MSVLPLSTFQYGGRVGRSLLSTQGTFRLVQGTAYFVYIGLTMGETTVPKKVELYMTTAGTVPQIAEIGMFSSAGAPNRLPVTFTKIAASASLTPFNSVGIKSNIANFTTPIPSLVHLWAALHTNTAGPVTSQPFCQSLANDWGYGLVLTTTSAPALTGPGTIVGTPVPAATFIGCPDLRICLD